jgi:hypothetical protein
VLVNAWNGVTVNIPWYRVDMLYIWACGRIAYAREMRKLTNMRRRWVAISPHGRVELGVGNYSEALTQAAKLGPISYSDIPNGLIFYNTDLGRIPQ